MTPELPRESQLLRRIRSLEDPRPHLNEAKNALTEMLSLRKDLLMLEAETRSWNQIRRILFALGTLMTFELGVGMTLFWLSWLLHEHGWPSGVLILTSLVLFGAITAGFAWATVYYGHRAYSDEAMEDPG